MTQRVREILNGYGADSPGTLTNLARLLNTGRLAGTWREETEQVRALTFDITVAEWYTGPIIP